METIYIDENNNNDYLNLEISKHSNICIFNKSFSKITIKALDNVNININEFNINSCKDTTINLYVGSDASIIYNLSNIVNNNYNLILNINFLGNNSKIESNIHSLVNGNEKINLIGTVKNNSKNNELLENVKVILNDMGKCEVNPDMIIDTNKVNAFHKVAISKIRAEEIFYLKGKGLSDKVATDLIKKSFLISNISNDELRIKINEQIGGE